MKYAKILLNILIIAIIKKIEEAIASGNAEEAKSALKEAQPKIMSVAQKGIFHKNTASRKISRLAKKVKNIS